jgi:serine/threonine protein kinase
MVYAAPEVLESCKYSTASDVYSIGLDLLIAPLASRTARTSTELSCTRHSPESTNHSKPPEFREVKLFYINI